MISFNRGVPGEYLIHDAHVFELAANHKYGLNKFRIGRFDVVIVDRAIPAGMIDR